MNYANQREILIDKNKVQKLYNEPGEPNFLHSLKWEEVLEVTRELDGNEFKIWMYCMKWTGEEKFYFSPAALIKDFNMSESTAQRGFKRLEQLQYLRKKKNSRQYEFFPQGARTPSK